MQHDITCMYVEAPHGKFCFLQQNKKADAIQIFHDTAGWKHLETSMRFVIHVEKMKIRKFIVTRISASWASSPNLNLYCLVRKKVPQLWCTVLLRALELYPIL